MDGDLAEGAKAARVAGDRDLKAALVHARDGAVDGDGREACLLEHADVDLVAADLGRQEHAVFEGDDKQVGAVAHLNGDFSGFFVEKVSACGMSLLRL